MTTVGPSNLDNKAVYGPRIVYTDNTSATNDNWQKHFNYRYQVPLKTTWIDELKKSVVRAFKPTKRKYSEFGVAIEMEESDPSRVFMGVNSNKDVNSVYIPMHQLYDIFVGMLRNMKPEEAAKMLDKLSKNVTPEIGLKLMKGE